MVDAALLTLLASSALIFGAVVTLLTELPRRFVGLLMGFGAGILLSSVAYELIFGAYEHATDERVGAAIALGALVYYGGDSLLGRGASERHARLNDESAENPGAHVLGAVLDGLPVAFVIGLVLGRGEGIAITVLLSVFLAKLAESVAASTALQRRGWTRLQLLGMWWGIVLASGFMAALGHFVATNTTDHNGVFAMAFAGGAVLTMIASTMLPEAYAEAGKPAGLLTVFGFSLAFVLAHVH